MQQLAERFAAKGHDVTVATTKLLNRNSLVINGVKIKEFEISGNYVSGINGEIASYQDYVKNSDFAVIMIKAAQQWTFDALWAVIDKINMRKVFIPCGFSGLYDQSFKDYFKKLPDILKRFDHLIFYAEHYRDIDFARQHGIKNYSIIPNGASEVEFSMPIDNSFRENLGIAEDSFIFLTVGSLTGAKGHLEVAEAFAKLDTEGRKITLILNGNKPITPIKYSSTSNCCSVVTRTSHCLSELFSLFKSASRALGVYKREGRKGVINRIINVVYRLAGHNKFIERILPLQLVNPLAFWVNTSNSLSPLKQVLLTDLPRLQLIQAFKNADLFVFASNIEYSPLVLFESVAAGTPFLSVPVGNAEEIARWTAAGIICPAKVDKQGLTRVNPDVLACEMKKAMNSEEFLSELGHNGHSNWLKYFTWAHIADRYEDILKGNASYNSDNPFIS